MTLQEQFEQAKAQLKEINAGRPEAEIYKREWVGLTNKELFEILDKANTRYQALQMTEDRLKEKNA
jgi:hypothetical protein